ncbi:MAG: glycosyltransferase family 2 protein [Bacteriovoracaceae bacterium]|nr:glycosyltransferase family 2 protein [Bacteriovoracaceae bacterium]
MKSEVKLSATIICFNEEDKIARCLESLKDIVDEIVVVDSFSTDKTPEIIKDLSKKLPIKFIQNPFEGHIEQKNFALDQATHDWVISLDADEALSETLIQSIKNTTFEKAGYCFNRLTNYNGFWVKHCGWYPDTKLRLVKKNQARWEGVNPHDILRLKTGEEGLLKGDLLHYSYDSITDHINQTNRFTTIAAKASFKNGARSSLFKIITRPILKFLKDYFLKAGFLDGRYGLIICTINALSAFLKYSKIKELQENRQI